MYETPLYFFFNFTCMRGDTEKIKKTFPLNLHWGTYKVRNEIETKRNEINENETKRNETKSTKTKRNETKSTK